MMVHGVPSEIFRTGIREIGEARTWYEMQNLGLGEEFVAAIALQLKRLGQAPMLYAEVIPKGHRALLPRFPYGLFYAVRQDLVYIYTMLATPINGRGLVELTKT